MKLLLFPPLLMLITIRMNAEDVFTYHNDNARTGQSLNEITLTPTNVSSATFGKLFALTADGKIAGSVFSAAHTTVLQRL